MIKIKNIFSKFLFISTLFYSKEVNFLYYNSSDSPDFPTYFNYFKYFFYEIENTSREQGLFYYFLNSWNFYSFSEVINEGNFFIYMHRSIQETNFYLYVFGLLGFYFLLKHFKFNQSSIFYTLALLNVLPLTIAMRVVLKPEIVGFAMIPWVILCFEKFLSEKKSLYLYSSIPFICIAISAKGSMFVMITIYLTLVYFLKVINFSIKYLVIVIGIFLFIFGGIYVEDSRANEINLIDLQSGAIQSDNYNFKAPKNIIYKLDVYRLFTSPIKYDHSGSLIGITLLDTFGDYFDVYWDNDSSNYSSERKVIFEYEKSSSISPPNIDLVNTKITVFDQKVPDLYFREFIGLIISIIFFINLFIYFLKNNEYSKFIFAPFIGVSVLVIHIITGFPVNNFDPSKGDTLKTIYYSFFLLLCFIFLFVQVLDGKKFKKIYVISAIFIMIFLLGFPKENTTQFSINLSNINNYSYFCEFNKLTVLQTIGSENLGECQSKPVIPILGFSEYGEYLDYKEAPRIPLFNLLVGLSCLFSSLLLIKSSYIK